MNKIAKFNIGGIVIHKRHGYRAVIVDCDALFQASGRYNPQSARREFSRRNPWYRLLVDESNQMTYVEECHLELDSNQELVSNPNIVYYFTQHQGDYYINAYRH